MMREIKFRGKRIDNGKWVYGYFCKTRMGICFITNDDLIHNAFDLYEVVPETVELLEGGNDGQ